MSSFESKYAAKFTKLALSKEGTFRFRGPNLLVEVLPKVEIKSKGGIVLQSGASQKAVSSDYQRDLGLVLMSGEGYSNEGNMDVNVGAIILMPFNPIYLSQFPGLQDYTQNTLAIVSENDVIFHFENMQALNKATELLNNEG